MSMGNNGIAMISTYGHCVEKIDFDSLMNKARVHASSCTVVPTLDPMHAIFLSILVEQQKEISSLREASSTDGRTIISDTSKEHLSEATKLPTFIFYTFKNPATPRIPKTKPIIPRRPKYLNNPLVFPYEQPPILIPVLKPDRDDVMQIQEKKVHRQKNQRRPPYSY